MEPVGTGKKGLASVAEIRNPWVSWGWEVGRETCVVRGATLRCSTYECPYVPGNKTNKIINKNKRN